MLSTDETPRPRTRCVAVKAARKGAAKLWYIRFRRQETKTVCGGTRVDKTVENRALNVFALCSRGQWESTDVATLDKLQLLEIAGF